MAYRKYRNVPTVIDNIHFDSKAEGRRYQQLKVFIKAGLITDLVPHPRYLLIPKYTNAKGDKIQAAYYEADFSYYDTEKGAYVIEDVKRKATATAVYKFKKKLFEYNYPDKTIVEVDA